MLFSHIWMYHALLILEAIDYVIQRETYIIKKKKPNIYKIIINLDLINFNNNINDFVHL